MKTLIESSIIVRGIGKPNSKTVFHEDHDKESYDYICLSKISGRKLSVFFKYTEDNIEKDDRLQMSIPRGLECEEVQEFIVLQLNNYLGN
jgi:hypothetical protein